MAHACKMKIYCKMEVFKGIGLKPSIFKFFSLHAYTIFTLIMDTLT